VIAERTMRKTPERKRKRKTKRTITRAVTHILLIEANPGKLEALNRVATAYLSLCQQYVTLFCTDQEPNKYADPRFPTELSERWQRVAIQQAAGIAQSWRTNRAKAYEAYLEEMADYAEAQASASPDPKLQEPVWKEWNTPTLRVPCIRANVNVVVLEPSKASTFDYWLRISTLDRGSPLRVPVKLASYHRKALQGRTINTSTTLHRRRGVWWLTLSFDEDVPQKTGPAAPTVGVDVGIANFVTTSTGKRYGSFHGKLRQRQKHDREKRRRKAKLRACLKKKGVQTLPSTSSRSGQRLARHVRQEINRAVNQMLAEHPDARVVYEELSVASMRYKARAMNAYLYASNLAHIPKQLVWGAAKRGLATQTVKAAYSSQECHRCHYPDRANRPDQQTFRCIICGHRDHADHNAAANLARRFGDQDLAACKNKAAVKALLLRRHTAWKKQYGLAVVQPAVQLSLFEASTDVAEC
jgi:Putative transposase DNA-binding domain